MKSYKDYLIEKGVPPGPWVIREREEEKPTDDKVVKFRRKK